MWQKQIYLAERMWSLLLKHCLLNFTRNKIAWQKQPTASFQSKYFLSVPAKLFSAWDTGLSPGWGFVLTDWDSLGL